MPSIDFTVARVQGAVPSDWGDVYVKNKSKYILSITGIASQGSAIKGYTIDGKWYSTNKSDYSYTSDFITKSGDVTITVWIEDERSRTTKKEITISVLDYFVPAFKNVLSQRTDATGVQVGNGNYFKSTYAVNFASCGGRNKYDVTIEYLMHGENQQYVLVEDLSAVAYGNNNILPDHSYTIRYGVKDSFTATPVYYYDEVSTETYTMFFKKGGKGVSFGKACESDNLLETEWDFKFNNKLLQKNGTEVPYIVEQGAYGIWTYEKWSNGKCELYGVDLQTVAVSVAAGGVFRSEQLTVALPFKVYGCHAFGDCLDRNAWASASNMQNDTSNILYHIWRGASYTEYPWYTYLLVKGRWK